MIDFAYTCSALYFSALNRLIKHKGIVILMYHRVHDGIKPSELVMPVRVFRQQMKYLKDHCDVLSLEQLQEYYRSKSSYGTKTRPQVVVTIDDGYRDTFQNAFPVLKEFGLPAIVFLATGFIGTNKSMRRYADMPAPDMMDWQEAFFMRQYKIAMGGHTVSHPDLSTLSFEEQKSEIDTSIKDIEKNLPGSKVRSFFCYPYGAYNHDTLRALKELGVTLSLTVNPGVNYPDDDPLQLKRLCADGQQTPFQFMKMINASPASGIRWRMNLLKDSFKNRGKNSTAETVQ